MEQFTKIQSAASFLKSTCNLTPAIGVLTGTGLALRGLVPEDSQSIRYDDIPNFPAATAPSHRGELHVGRIGEMNLAIFQGRFHLYEGHSPWEVTFPIRVMQLWGVKSLIILNASGSVSTEFSSGDLAVLSDHINFMQSNPLIGKNLDQFGPRFPDMSSVYTVRLRRHCQEVAQELGIPVREAIYLALKGPSLETMAEYKMVKTLGADLVGMSTVPEVIAAGHGGMHVLGLSIVSNQVRFDQEVVPTTIEDVIEVVRGKESTIESLIRNLILQWPSN